MSTAIIPELSYLLQVVEKTYGRKLYTTTDFESLSIIIENKIGELISSSTLKRLYGQIHRLSQFRGFQKRAQDQSEVQLQLLQHQDRMRRLPSEGR